MTEIQEQLPIFHMMIFLKAFWFSYWFPESASNYIKNILVICLSDFTSFLNESKGGKKMLWPLLIFMLKQLVWE